MTIRLPADLEGSIQAAVHSGRFASIDDAIAEAVRLLLRELALSESSPPDDTKLRQVANPLLGLMRHDAELMDEIVADAYRQRREDQWRELEL